MQKTRAHKSHATVPLREQSLTADQTILLKIGQFYYNPNSRASFIEKFPNLTLSDLLPGEGYTGE